MKAPASSDVERQALLGAIAGGLAHELRNPLSTMSVHLQLLREDWSSPATTKERLSLRRIEILLRECRRLEEVLSDFLRFAGGHRPTLRPSDLNTVVQETLDFVAPEAEQHGLRVVSSLAPDLPPVPLDSALFKQALLNILINAEQAMSKGGSLSVFTARDRDTALLTV
ncbi:MAG: two-component sensor histidine kinase, partial [Planctomycetes bacterium]|nr:two-component sensor histidine kinase [Planctomycetota bacterium]